ncbi:Hexokinase [Fusarium oxysporum f. sp. albedinis]|nr:Hexokinase [Fusarium oxysporum f. sp. albedinis]
MTYREIDNSQPALSQNANARHIQCMLLWVFRYDLNETSRPKFMMRYLFSNTTPPVSTSDIESPTCIRLTRHVMKDVVHYVSYIP